MLGDMDLSNSEKNGILYMEDQLEREWVPHFFVLTDSKMYYTEVHPEENEPEEADDDDSETAQRRLREVQLFYIPRSSPQFLIKVKYFSGCSRVRASFWRRMVSRSALWW